MGVAVEIRLLGEPGVVIDGSARVTTERESLLLALLGTRLNAVVSSEHLNDAIWPTGPSRSALHVLVSRVRKLLPSDADVRITTTHVGYRLEGPDDAVDVARFERALAAGRRAAEADRHPDAERRLRDALDLWDRPFGALGDHVALVAEARRLGELRAQAEELLSDELLAQGRHDVDIDRFQRLVDEDPVRERRWMQLMVALYRSDRQTEALRRGVEARRFLRDEVGVEPGPELDRLEQAILDHDESLAAPRTAAAPRFRLPAHATSFVGREAERVALRELIATHRLVTVWGPGGVGKSRTVLEVVGELASEVRHGAVHVGMSSADDFGSVLDLLALSIGVTRADHHDLEILVAHLAETECFVVLDNCEHLGHEVAELARRVLESCPDVRVVVTSQRPLGILGETRWRLPLMRTDPDDDGMSDAERLFHERALAEDRSAWRRSDVVALCEGLDGLPLALELAAALTPSLSPTEILARLGDRFELLAADHPTSPRHHRTLAATIDWSHSFLSDAGAALLARASVFEGGFTLDAAQAVCADEGIEPADVLGLVTELVSHSLLSSRPTPDGTRYQLLESIRLFAQQRLEASGRTEHYLARHRRYFLELAHATGRSVYLDDGESIRLLAAEQKNLRAALEHATSTGDHEGALRLANDLHPFWMLQGLTQYGRSQLDRLLRPQRPLSATTARAHLADAILAAFDGDYPAAEVGLARARDQFERLDQPKQVAWTAFWRGRALTAATLAGAFPVDRLEEAAAEHTTAIRYFQSHDDHVSLLAASPFAGLCGVLRRDPRGRRLIEQAYRAATGTGLRRHIALAGSMLALCLGQEGDHDPALVLLADAADTLTATGDRLNESIVRAVYAQVALAAGDLDLATRTALDDLDLQLRHGTREWEPFVLAVAWTVLQRREAELDRGAGDADRLATRLDLLVPNWTQSLVLTAVGTPVERPSVPYAARADAVAVAGVVQELSDAMAATIA